jgi:hypothetical protein
MASIEARVERSPWELDFRRRLRPPQPRPCVGLRSTVPVVARSGRTHQRPALRRRRQETAAKKVPMASLWLGSYWRTTPNRVTRQLRVWLGPDFFTGGTISRSVAGPDRFLTGLDGRAGHSLSCPDISGGTRWREADSGLSG